MNFICSVNEVVAEHLDPETGRIASGGNFASFNENWEALELTTLELAERLGKSVGVCAWHLQEGKRIANVTGLIKAGLIIVDIDNQADHKDSEGNKVQKQELTPEEALELDICKKYLTLAYYSPSSTKTWPRFRLIFGLQDPVINQDFYKWFTKEIYKQIPGSDVRATTAPHLFYGPRSKDHIFSQPGKFIPTEKIKQALIVHAQQLY